MYDEKVAMELAPFLSFVSIFNILKVHNVFTLMLDKQFKIGLDILTTLVGRPNQVFHMVAKYDSTTIMLIQVPTFHFLNLGVALSLLKLQNLIKNIQFLELGDIKLKGSQISNYFQIMCKRIQGATYQKITIYIIYLHVNRMLGIIYENVLKIFYA